MMRITAVLVLLLVMSGKGIRIRFETVEGIRTIKGVKPGELLRSSLLKRGISPHNGNANLINCRGLGTCGTCAIDIQKGSVEPRDRTKIEDLRLSLPPHNASSSSSSSLRLACQCRVADDDLLIIKRAGFWGSKPEKAQDISYPSLPLGKDLEFILDPTSDSITCGECNGSQVSPCPNCEASGLILSSPCPACKGSGQVICRSCFNLPEGPYDLSAVRRAAQKRPD